MAEQSGSRVAVVTGGGTGLGRASANVLTRDGFAVAVIGRRADRLIPGDGENLFPYTCDVADHTQVRRTVSAVLSDHGRIDVLVNFAGVVGAQELIESITYDNVRQVINTNLIGTINFSVACARPLKETKGTVINMSSALARRPAPGTAVYAATKGGVEAFSLSLALELAEFGVRVNVVSPSLVRSEIFLAAGMDPQTLPIRFTPTLTRARMGANRI